MFAAIALIFFWYLAAHPDWVEDGGAPAGMLVFLGFLYRRLWPEKISGRGIVYAVALFIGWWLAFYVWVNPADSAAVGGVLVFLLFLHAILWPQQSISLHHRRQRGIVEIIPKSRLRRISERTIDQPLRKRIAAQPGASHPR